MKENEKIERVVKNILEGEEFKGYTIDELRFQRKLKSKEIDFCRAKLNRHWENLQGLNPLMPGNKTSLPGKAGAVALKLLNGLNYLDYILLGLSVFKGTRKVFSFFRVKRK